MGWRYVLGATMTGPCVIQHRTTGRYVSKPGSASSYALALTSARVFPSREAAESQRCVESERVVPVTEVLPVTRDWAQ